jgi:hypothetical protein
MTRAHGKVPLVERDPVSKGLTHESALAWAHFMYDESYFNEQSAAVDYWGSLLSQLHKQQVAGMTGSFHSRAMEDAIKRYAK